jgi:hypothetical protein
VVTLIRVACLAAIAIAAGCSIHPLPEDFSGVSSYTIVRQIRCETRKVIADSAIGWLTAADNEDRVDAVSRAIGQQFASGRPIQEFRPELFKGRVRSIIQLFFDTGVAYNFELTMAEVNNLSAEVNLLKPFTSSKLTLGIKGGADRLRKNTRLFTVTDTFSGLVRLPDTYCAGHDLGRPYNHVVEANYVYPITGKIGVERLVHDFINLTLFANLAGKAAAPTGPPTISDMLEFDTFLTGTVAPRIAFTPSGRALQVADASASAVASRRDTHKITMALAIAGPGASQLAPVRTAIFTPQLVSTTARITNAEARAVEAVNQALTLQLFRPTVIVTP